MIYTLTLNPALDYTVRLARLAVGETNRSGEESLRLGGKGLNVSSVLYNLGVPTVAYGCFAGEIGELMRRKAEALPFEVRPLEGEGESRINLKIKAEKETEINASGAKLKEEERARFKRELALLEVGDFVVFAGSTPPGMRSSVYLELMQAVKEGVHCVVDTTGEALKSALVGRPFLVKPNEKELGDLFGVRVENKEQAVVYAKKVCALGARNCLVSLGGDGAVLVTDDGEVLTVSAPQGTVVDTVGAGDSVVAGFLWKASQGADLKTAFLAGVCAGSATAFSSGLATKEQVEALLSK